MPHILVVDDEESICFSLKAFLEGAGHSVRSASGYAEAVASISDQEPDLIFADILLRGKSGIDLLKHVKELGLRCPVVMITGEPSFQTAAEAVRLGAFDYVPKPINKDTLLRSARVALRHKQLEDEKGALLAEKERLRLHLEAVFRSVPDAIVTVGRDGLVQQANHATQEVLRIAQEAMVGRHISELCNKGYEPLCEVVMQTLRSEKAVREFRVECVSADGEQTLVLNCAPLLDDADKNAGVVLLLRDISHLAGLERELTERKEYQRIVGKSRRMQEIYGLIEDLGETDTTVLITGPSGTGKELVAQALHNGGNRANKSLVKVNCSALSENLLESELFGHVRGAFTGAVKDKAGRFALAHGGTIFLDEIGDISARIQLKLLRVLQEKEFEPVGDTRTIKVDVRVIAATNRNLREKVKTGEFREDLYYRLKVVELVLPPLCERREDIPLLTEHFIKLFNKQFGKRLLGIDDEVNTAFMRYAWPGNIRELKHAIEHAFILCRGLQIEIGHLPLELRADTHESGASAGGCHVDHDDLQRALRQAGGNKAKAARALGVSRQTIYRKLREFQS